MILQVGDPITLVVSGEHETRLVLDHVTETTPDDVFATASLSVRRYKRESVSWIRGHHAENTEEGAALLAAFALARAQ